MTGIIRGNGDFTRYAKSIAQSTNTSGAVELAENTRASARVIAALRAKAATSAGSLANDTWAGDMADSGGLAASFISALTPRSIFYRIAERANTFPMRSRVIAMAALPVGIVAETAWTPVIAGAFTPIDPLEPVKCGAIVVFTKDLLDRTDPASFAVVKRELERGALAAVDGTFWDIAMLGVVPIPAPDLMVGIAGLLDSVSVTGAESLVFVTGIKMANALSTATDSAGARLFPTMGPSGGLVLGVEVAVSDRVDADVLALVDAQGFNTNMGSIDVDLSRHGSLKMKTDPDGPAEMVSLFQTNTVALRVIAAFAAVRNRDNAIAAIKLAA